MSETTKRILSAAVLVPMYIFAFTYSGVYYIQLILVVYFFAFLAIREFYIFSDRQEDGRPFRGTGYFFIFLVTSLYYFHFLKIQKNFTIPDFLQEITKYLSPDFDLVVPAFFLLFLVSFALQIMKRPLDGAIFSVATTILGVLYIAVPFGHFMLLISFPHGVYYIWAVSGITIFTDTGAYFGGRLLGRHPAGLQISPKKTWEGYVSGVITAIVFLYLLNFFWEKFSGEVPAFGMIESFFIALGFSLISVLGDLSESAMKRDAKLKDSASLIPGHGGILDLIDALLLTFPTMYYFIKIKEVFFS
ncbi:MAG: phosphatidate cytidylyltransferase [Leptospiraceae bacterium]|nr:phosphatidate cytidylyltransferase [Leptospiraceae bacterium]MCK6380101.1 phosphatidate cytidylyltransferase [Leptospiraceae bacterium]NUM40526.1 phosphatidate cytidylyltransferase [Leptospiraceae bacterium]